MSPPGRPKGESPSAQREGSAIRPSGVRYGVPALAELVHAAGDGPTVFLPKVEAHPVGMAVGAVALLLGVAAGALASPTLGWVALVVMMGAMLLHARVMRVRSGWEVDFAARRVTPQGVYGEVEQIGGDGWSIVCAPGPPAVTKLDEMAAVICVDPDAIGELCSVEARSNLPSLAAISVSITVTGSGLLKGVTDWMWVPVTTMASLVSSAAASSSPSAASCAKAGVESMIAIADTPSKPSLRRAVSFATNFFMIVSSSSVRLDSPPNG